jgi:hypothetical protein
LDRAAQPSAMVEWQAWELLFESGCPLAVVSQWESVSQEQGRLSLVRRKKEQIQE